ncbi:hypothetical protein GCM10010495_49380 [Kitasatospora herbaricolor]|uniref:peptidoglycan-binding protein n=1 Tax=Kitasatospora herbaricolor TaxID=68217 RepID=UPI0017493332|nr:peptidoglycan-binding protein [Kitasatospora herbaricolor]MDQ0305696.1 hypothetical protein [Kitasatospora herbaricolor]GGV27382.1 hypothetical protein GCM10010495_49380 [Kitasatospora herbaricolor]
MSSRKGVRTGATTTLLAVALAVTGVLTTGPSAQAAVGQGYVNGFDAVGDDWNDEGVLSVTQHSHSGAAGLWQMVLYADGYLSESGVDCKFGNGTDSATRQWQSNHGVTSDGAVGGQTFGRAGGRLFLSSDGIVGFSGEARTVYFVRNTTSGAYGFRGPLRGFTQADYAYPDGC